MLHEISHLRQTDRRLNKRWFTCRDMDLFIWSRRKTILNISSFRREPIHFQLSFNKQNKEHVISWNNQSGFHLYLVDSGETTPDSYKKSPLLIETLAQQDWRKIISDFLSFAVHIDTSITDFIHTHLLEHCHNNA